MSSAAEREVRFRMRSQHGVIGRRELRALGIDSRMEARRVAVGEWERLGRIVVRAVAAPPSGLQTLFATCIEAGPSSVVSHQSAAWLWDMIDEPHRHSVTVHRTSGSKVGWADVHRLAAPAAIVDRRGLPCTNPLRTIADLAAVVPASDLDGAIDRALASRLITVGGLEAELERLSSPGRRGTGKLRAALRRRGLVAPPHPSVLESRVLRLLRAAGIEPVAVEVRVGSDGRYRVEVMLAIGVLMEVDGYSFHHTPEQKAEDERRRNRLRLDGNFLLVYSWRDVVYDGRRIVHELRQALSQAAILSSQPATGR